MTEKELYRTLNEVSWKEELIEDTVEHIENFSNTRTQSRLYSYALKLLNFDY